MPSLSCWSDKFFTSFKVCSESKYTKPATNVSAKTGVDVMNNAMITNVAANNNFVCGSLAADATTMRFDRITSSYSNVIRRLPQQKDRIRIVPLEVMVTSLLAGFYVTSLLSNAYRILEAMSPILHGFLLQQVSTSPAMMESRPCSPRP